MKRKKPKKKRQSAAQKLREARSLEKLIGALDERILESRDRLLADLREAAATVATIQVAVTSVQQSIQVHADDVARLLLMGARRTALVRRALEGTNG